MKLISTLLFLATIGSVAQAQRANDPRTYKILTLTCAHQNQSVVFYWDFSKSPLLLELLVNGQNELNHTQWEWDPKLDHTTYSKGEIFSVTFTPEDGGKNEFTKEVLIQGQWLTTTCTKTEVWKYRE